jgi:hypothetical protein
MPVTLSTKSGSSQQAAAPGQSSRRHRARRSQTAVPVHEGSGGRRMTPRQVLAEVTRLGVRTPAEAAKMLRADRNAR